MEIAKWPKVSETLETAVETLFQDWSENAFAAMLINIELVKTTIEK